MVPERKVLRLYPQTVASNGTNGILVVDLRPTSGPAFGHAFFDVMVGPGAATTAPTTLALQESDADDTNYANVMPFVGGTATSATVGFVIPTIATSAASGKSFHFGVNALGRKRFLKLSVVAGTTATVSIACSLVRPDNTLAANTTGSGGDFFLIG
jgi:hypothetical protein